VDTERRPPWAREGARSAELRAGGNVPYTPASLHGGTRSMARRRGAAAAQGWRAVHTRWRRREGAAAKAGSAGVAAMAGGGVDRRKKGGGRTGSRAGGAFLPPPTIPHGSTPHRHPTLAGGHPGPSDQPRGRPNSEPIGHPPLPCGLSFLSLCAVAGGAVSGCARRSTVRE